MRGITQEGEMGNCFWVFKEKLEDVVSDTMADDFVFQCHKPESRTKRVGWGGHNGGRFSRATSIQERAN